MPFGLRLHLHVVKPGNPSSMEPSQRRNGKHAEHHCYDNQRCLSSTISEFKNKAWHSNKHMHTTRAKSLRRRLSSTRRTVTRMHESLSTSPWSPVGLWTREGSGLGTWITDIFPIRLKVILRLIQDWSIRRTDRSRGYMQPYRELGNELDKNYDYERILSTSRGSSGSSAIITERICDYIWTRYFLPSLFKFLIWLLEWSNIRMS